VVSAIAGVLLGPWCWAALTAAFLFLVAASWALMTLADRFRRWRDWRELDRDLAAMEAGRATVMSGPVRPGYDPCGTGPLPPKLRGKP
jgi:hypothetical protein